MTIGYRSRNTNVATTPFVGRTQELQAVVGKLQQDFPQFIIVRGPAGIGKSRFFDEVTTKIAPKRVVPANCWNAAVSPPYWPWIQIFRQLLDEPVACDLSELVSIGQHLTRFELFEAVAENLRSLQETHSFVLYFDDLHQADAQSLLLLEFLLRNHRAELPHILASKRFYTQDTEERQLLQNLSDIGSALDLGPLTSTEVAQLLPEPGEAETVHRVTSGIPLAVVQILGSSQPLDLTLKTKDFTRRRIAQLPESQLWVVSALAISEQPLNLDEVCALTTFEKMQVSDDLSGLQDQGITARLSTSRGATSWEITHPLFAESAVELSSAAALGTLHARRASMLEHSPTRQARHLIQASPVDYSVLLPRLVLAIEEAIEQAAFEEAIELCRLISDEQYLAHQDNEYRLRVHLLKAAALWRSGQFSEARDIYSSAQQVATRLGSPIWRARALFGPELRFDLGSGHAIKRAGLCAEILKDLPAQAKRERLRLLATQAVALGRIHAPQAPEVLRELEHVVADTADVWAQGYLEVARCFVLSLQAKERLDLARRILAIVDETDEVELSSAGTYLLQTALLEIGQIQSFESEVRLLGNDDVAGTLNRRYRLWYLTLRATLDGDIGRAQELASEAHRVAKIEGDPDADYIYSINQGVLAWMSGDMSALEEVFMRARTDSPDELFWKLSLGWLWQLQGRTNIAAALLAQAPKPEDVPAGDSQVATWMVLADMAIAREDRDQMLTLRELLLPYAQNLVAIGHGLTMWGYAGAVLGKLARGLGELEEAEFYYGLVIRMATKMQAHAWLVEAQVALAHIMWLKMQQKQADRKMASNADTTETAVDLLRNALASARARGFVMLEAQGTQVLELFECGPPVELAELPEDGRDLESAAQGQGLVGELPLVRVIGGFQVIGVGGEVSSWSSRKARTLLKLLISRMGAPVARDVVVETLWPQTDEHKTANRLAVALSTVRRALDPVRKFATDHFVYQRDEAIAINLDRVRTDVADFIKLSRSESPEDWGLAVEMYAGEVFADVPYAPWAQSLRSECRSIFQTLGHRLAEHLVADEKFLEASQIYRKLIMEEHYDERAYDGLILTLEECGAQREVLRVAEDRRAMLAELG